MYKLNHSHPRSPCSSFVGLDYTNNFEGNKSPDEFLYRFLADLYGTVDGLPWDSNSTDTAEGGGGDATGTAVDSSSPWNPFGWGNGGRRRNRVLRTSGSSVSSNSRESRRLFSSVQDETRRQALLSQWAEINASIMNGSSGSERQGWRLLHQSEFGVSHEMQLDDDFTVQIHKLLA